MNPWSNNFKLSKQLQGSVEWSQFVQETCNTQLKILTKLFAKPKFHSIILEELDLLVKVEN